MKKFSTIFLVFALVMMAGCVDPEAVITVDELNSTEEVAESASINATDTNEGIEGAVVNGTSEPTTRDTDVEERSELVSYQGKYYEITKEKVGTTQSKVVEVNVTRTSDEAEYQIESLSEKDAELVRDFQRYEDRDEDSPRPRLGQRYVQEEINNSVLLDEREIVVESNNRSYRVEVLNVDNRTEDLFVYRSSVEFNSSQEFGEHIIGTYAFELESIPENSTDVWNEAVNSGGYYGQHTNGYENLRELFVDEEAFERYDNRGTWFVRYNGQLYRAELDWISEPE